jgi:hypothetical protein
MRKTNTTITKEKATSENQKEQNHSKQKSLPLNKYISRGNQRTKLQMFFPIFISNKSQ